MAWQTLSLLLCCCQKYCVELSLTQKCKQVPTTFRNQAAAALKEKKEERGVRDMFRAAVHKWHTERHAALNTNARLSEQEDTLLEIEVTFT